MSRRLAGFIRCVGIAVLLFCLSQQAWASGDGSWPEERVRGVLTGRYVEIAGYKSWLTSGCSASFVEFSSKQERPLEIFVRGGCMRFGKQTKTNGWLTLGKKQPQQLTFTRQVAFGLTFERRVALLLADEEMGYVVIGAPKAGMLWILSRQANLDAQSLAEIFWELAAGYGEEILASLSCSQQPGGDVAACEAALAEIVPHALGSGGALAFDFEDELCAIGD